MTNPTYDPETGTFIREGTCTHGHNAWRVNAQSRYYCVPCARAATARSRQKFRKDKGIGRATPEGRKRMTELRAELEQKIAAMAEIPAAVARIEAMLLEAKSLKP